MKRNHCYQRVSKVRGIGNLQSSSSLDTYDKIVDEYIRIYRNDAQAELRFFKNCSLPMAIRYASRCMRSDGKRNGHHRRRSQQTLGNAESVLRDSAAEIQACATFHELHELIRCKINPIRGVGALFVYDAAVVIGASLDISPDRIYLHSGTAAGAKAILAIRGQRTITRSELPPAFRRLRCCEVEDCLCIYKRDLAEIARQLLPMRAVN